MTRLAFKRSVLLTTGLWLTAVLAALLFFGVWPRTIEGWLATLLLGPPLWFVVALPGEFLGDWRRAMGRSHRGLRLPGEHRASHAWNRSGVLLILLLFAVWVAALGLGGRYLTHDPGGMAQWLRANFRGL